jgi:hypothetical protein
VSDVNEFTTDPAQLPEQPGKLREQLERAIELLKEKDQAIAEMQTKAAEGAARAVWDELKVPQPIRDMYKGDTTPDGIRSWWDSSKSLFNLEVAEETPAETPDQKAQRESLAAVQGASALGSDKGAGTGYDQAALKGQELRNKSDRVSQAELDDYFRTAGIPKGLERIVRT